MIRSADALIASKRRIDKKKHLLTITLILLISGILTGCDIPMPQETAVNSTRNITDSAANDTQESAEDDTAAVTNLPLYTVEIDTNSPPVDYRSLYKRKLQELSVYPEKNNMDYCMLVYALINMNKNNIPELLVMMETCEADYTFTFYSAASSGIREVSEDFSDNRSWSSYSDNGFGSITESRTIDTTLIDHYTG